MIALIELFLANICLRWEERQRRKRQPLVILDEFELLKW